MTNLVSGRQPLLPLLLFLSLVPVPVFGQAAGPALQVLGVDAGRPEHLEFLLDVPEAPPVPGVAEFQLLEDGRETARASGLRPFRNSGWSLATVLAVDTSGSVRRYIADVGSVLPDFVAQHPPNDAFAVVTFDDTVQLRAPIGAPRDQLRASLVGLGASGKRTLLYAALERSIESLDAVPRARAWRRVILISDGADESGDQPNATDAVIKHAQSAGITIDTIWVGQPVASTRNTLVRLAERTGGIHSDVSDPRRVADSLRAALARTSARVNEAVVVGFDRRVSPGAMTDQVGVRMARPGIAPALIALQVARSAPPVVPPPPESPWVRIVTRLLLGLVVSYFSYAAVSILVFKKPAVDVLLLRNVWRVVPEPTTTVVAPLPLPLPAVRRHTMVGDPAPVVSPERQAQTLFLEGVEGPLRGSRIAIDRPQFRIGAAKSNELQIASDKYLSSLHAVIQTSKTGWMVLDKDSSNGTYVDGHKVGSGGQELQDGQRLRVGGSEFHVVLGVAAPVQRAPAAESAPR